MNAIINISSLFLNLHRNDNPFFSASLTNTRGFLKMKNGNMSFDGCLGTINGYDLYNQSFDSSSENDFERTLYSHVFSFSHNKFDKLSSDSLQINNNPYSIRIHGSTNDRCDPKTFSTGNDLELDVDISSIRILILMDFITRMVIYGGETMKIMEDSLSELKKIDISPNSEIKNSMEEVNEKSIVKSSSSSDNLGISKLQQKLVLKINLNMAESYFYLFYFILLLYMLICIIFIGMIFIPESSLSTSMVVLSLDSLRFSNSHQIIKSTQPVDNKYLPIIHYSENDVFAVNGLSIFFVKNVNSESISNLKCIPLYCLPNMLSIFNSLSEDSNFIPSSYFLNFNSSIYDLSTSSLISLSYTSSSIISPFSISGNILRLLDEYDATPELSKVLFY
jgi:hypothetical protein